MKQTLALICIFGWAAGLVAPRTAPAQPASSLAITGATIVDVVEGQLEHGQTILVTGDQITAVGAAETIQIPEGARSVDAEGKYVIPGLWDMHIHWYGIDSMKLFPINGVVGVRVMWGAPMHHKWRKLFEAGQRIGPHMIIASAIIDGPEPIWPGSIVAADDDAGRKAIEKAVAANADFAKVYSLLSRDTYFAIAEAAKKKGLPFDGHVPLMVSAREASDAGQRSMEHLYELILACSSQEEELRTMLADQVDQDERGNVRSLLRGGKLRREVSRRALDSFDETKAAALFKKFGENETWQCPTLTVLRNLVYGADAEIRENPNLQYMPKSMLSYLAPPRARFERNPEDAQYEQKKLQLYYRILKMIHDSGVPILAGTDCLNPYCLPGFSLHGEMQLMVEKVGLSPIDALRAATINAARFVDNEESMGSIARGKIADLVLLDANPLENIRNTTRINSVILRGKLFDRLELDEMLTEFNNRSGRSESDNNDR